MSDSWAFVILDERFVVPRYPFHACVGRFDHCYYYYYYYYYYYCYE
jgi:hypothetical protein